MSKQISLYMSANCKCQQMSLQMSAILVTTMTYVKIAKKIQNDTRRRLQSNSQNRDAVVKDCQSQNLKFKSRYLEVCTWLQMVPNLTMSIICLIIRSTEDYKRFSFFLRHLWAVLVSQYLKMIQQVTSLNYIRLTSSATFFRRIIISYLISK